jgi:urease accessory protein
MTSLAQTDIAPYIGASLSVMKHDADIMRDNGPTLFCAIKHGDGVGDVADLILAAWRSSGASSAQKMGKGKGKGKETVAAA